MWALRDGQVPLEGMVEEHTFSGSSSGQEDAEPPSEDETSEISSEPELEGKSEAADLSEGEDSDPDAEHGDAGAICILSTLEEGICLSACCNH